MAKKKYFRFHRGAFKDSMKIIVEVNDLDDIRRIIEDDALIKGYYKNIRISDGLTDHRCVPYGWGDMSYYVLADFGGYTGQCIGMADFKEI